MDYVFPVTALIEAFDNLPINIGVNFHTKLLYLHN